MDPTDVANLIRTRAPAYGIEPDQAIRVASSEGLNSYAGDNGSSFGPFQLHYGGVASGGNSVSGLGDVFTKQTGLDARDPKTVPQQVDFALAHAAQNGWGAWHGWKGDPYAGILGKPSMPTAQPDPTQQTPPLQQAMQSVGNGVSTLFGGNPTPVGALGGLGRMLGIGTEDGLGRRLQNAGASLIAINNPQGGAALQQAANMPHFNVITDALGNRYVLNTRTGQVGGPNGMPNTVGGAGVPGAPQNGSRPTALNQAPIAMAAQAKEDADLSAKKMASLDQAAADAQGLIDQNKLAMQYSQNPNTVQGPGIMNMLREKAANLTNGSIGGVDLPTQESLEKLNAQLVAGMLSTQKGVRFAAPEIAFGHTASADTEKPALASQQIYQDNIQNLQRAIDVRNIARQHYASGLSLNGPEFSKAVEDYQAKHPVYQAGAVQPGRGAGDNAPAIPKVGEARQGFVFKGGNPGDPNSWEKQ